MREKKDDFNEVRVSVRAYVDSKKSVPFAFMMQSIFPLIVPECVRFPKDATNACDRLRKKRNKAIHEPSKFKAAGLKEELDAVNSLLQFLIANHPKDERRVGAPKADPSGKQRPSRRARKMGDMG
jgi:hypothetical protein